MAEGLDTLSFLNLSVSSKNSVGGVPLLYLQYIMGSDEYTPDSEMDETKYKNTYEKMVDESIPPRYNPRALRKKEDYRWETGWNIGCVREP